MSFFNCCTVEDLNSGKIGAQGDSNVKGQAMEIERVENLPLDFQNLSQKDQLGHLKKTSPNWSFAISSSVQKFLELKNKWIDAVSKDKELDAFAKKPVRAFLVKGNGAYLGQCEEKDAEKKLYERQGIGHFADGEGKYMLCCWERDLPNRFGLIVQSNGEYFLGEFVNGKRVYGVHYCPTQKRTFKGAFDNNEFPYGAGVIEFDNGRMYKGIINKGVPNGVGTYSWPNGNYYEGQFVDGKQHGSGDLFVASTGESDQNDSSIIQDPKTGKSGKLFKSTVWDNGVLKS